MQRLGSEDPSKNAIHEVRICSFTSGSRELTFPEPSADCADTVLASPGIQLRFGVVPSRRSVTGLIVFLRSIEFAKK
jgi:hypothetical protein